MPRLLVLCALLASVGCESDDADLAELFANPDAWVDLTYAFNAQTIYWPTAETFRIDTVSAGMTPGGWYYTAFNFHAAEHGGTHLDAPVHFADGMDASDEIPLSRLIGPAAVIDVTAGAGTDADYLVTVADLERYETDHGRIPDGAIVLIHTGWGSRWPDPMRYLGTDRRGPDAVPDLHFPGIDSSAARWLVDHRSVGAVGIDTPSIDYGQSSAFDTHRILYRANIPGFENVAHLERVPPTGAYVIEGGSGGPLRIVALLPTGSAAR